MKGQKTALQDELAILQQKEAERITFDEASVLWALRDMREAVTNARGEEDLKQVYQKFIDSVEVFEGYVTVALDVFSMMGYRRRVTISGHEKRPPLEFNQMVTWNGGAEAPSVYNTITRTALNRRYNPRFTRLQSQATRSDMDSTLRI